MLQWFEEYNRKKKEEELAKANQQAEEAAARSRIDTKRAKTGGKDWWLELKQRYRRRASRKRVTETGALRAWAQEQYEKAQNEKEGDESDSDSHDTSLSVETSGLTPESSGLTPESSGLTTTSNEEECRSRRRMSAGSGGKSRSKSVRFTIAEAPEEEQKNLADTDYFFGEDGEDVEAKGDKFVAAIAAAVCAARASRSGSSGSMESGGSASSGTNEGNQSGQRRAQGDDTPPDGASDEADSGNEGPRGVKETKGGRRVFKRSLTATKGFSSVEEANREMNRETEDFGLTDEQLAKLVDSYDWREGNRRRSLSETAAEEDEASKETRDSAFGLSDAQLQHFLEPAGTGEAPFKESTPLEEGTGQTEVRARSMTIQSMAESVNAADSEYGLGDDQISEAQRKYSWSTERQRAMTGSSEAAFSQADSDFGVSDQQLERLIQLHQHFGDLPATDRNSRGRYKTMSSGGVRGSLASSTGEDGLPDSRRGSFLDCDPDNGQAEEPFRKRSDSLSLLEARISVRSMTSEIEARRTSETSESQIRRSQKSQRSSQRSSVKFEENGETAVDEMQEEFQGDVASAKSAARSSIRRSTGGNSKQVSFRNRCESTETFVVDETRASFDDTSGSKAQNSVTGMSRAGRQPRESIFSNIFDPSEMDLSDVAPDKMDIADSDAAFGISDRQLRNYSWVSEKERERRLTDTSVRNSMGSESDFGLSEKQLLKLREQYGEKVGIAERSLLRKRSSASSQAISEMSADPRFRKLSTGTDYAEGNDAEYGLSESQLQELDKLTNFRQRTMTDGSNRSRYSIRSSDSAFGLSEAQITRLSRKYSNLNIHELLQDLESCKRESIGSASSSRAGSRRGTAKLLEDLVEEDEPPATPRSMDQPPSPERTFSSQSTSQVTSPDGSLSPQKGLPSPERTVSSQSSSQLPFRIEDSLSPKSGPWLPPSPEGTSSSQDDSLREDSLDMPLGAEAETLAESQRSPKKFRSAVRQVIEHNERGLGKQKRVSFGAALQKKCAKAAEDIIDVDDATLNMRSQSTKRKLKVESIAGENAETLEAPHCRYSTIGDASEDGRSNRGDSDYGLSQRQLENYNWDDHRPRSMTGETSNAPISRTVSAVSDSVYGLSEHQLHHLCEEYGENVDIALKELQKRSRKSTGSRRGSGASIGSRASGMDFTIVRSLTKSSLVGAEGLDSEFGLDDSQMQGYNFKQRRLSNTSNYSETSHTSEFGLSDRQIRRVSMKVAEDRNMSPFSSTESDLSNSSSGIDEDFCLSDGQIRKLSKKYSNAAITSVLPDVLEMMHENSTSLGSAVEPSNNGKNEERRNSAGSNAECAEVAWNIVSGYMTGEELHAETMTINEARLKCTELRGCGGFYYQGSPDAAMNEASYITFCKSSDAREGWRTYTSSLMLEAPRRNKRSASTSSRDTVQHNIATMGPDGFAKFDELLEDLPDSDFGLSSQQLQDLASLCNFKQRSIYDSKSDTSKSSEDNDADFGLSDEQLAMLRRKYGDNLADTPTVLSNMGVPDAAIKSLKEKHGEDLRPEAVLATVERRRSSLGLESGLSPVKADEQQVKRLKSALPDVPADTSQSVVDSKPVQDKADSGNKVISDDEFGLSDEKLQQLIALYNWKQRSMEDGSYADCGLWDEQLKALLQKCGDSLENTEAILHEMGVPEKTMQYLKEKYNDSFDIPAVMAEVKARKAKKAAMLWQRAAKARKEAKMAIQQPSTTRQDVELDDEVGDRGRIFSDAEFGLSDEQLQQLVSVYNWRQRSIADDGDVAGEGSDEDFGLSDEQLKALLEKCGDNLENTEAILSEMGVPEQTIQELKCKYNDALDISAVMTEVQAAKAKKAAMTWKQAANARKEAKAAMRQASTAHQDVDLDEEVDERGRIFSDGEFGLSDEQLQQLVSLHNWKRRSIADDGDVAGDGSDADFGLSDEQLKALLEKCGDNIDNTETILSEMGVPEKTIKGLKEKYNDALDIPAVMTEVKAGKAKKAAMLWQRATKARKEAKLATQQAETDAEVDVRGRIFTDADFGLSDEQLQQLISLHNWKQRSMADGNDVAGDGSDADFGLSDEQLKALLEKYGDNLENTEAILSEMGVPEQTIQDLKNIYKDILDIPAVMTEVQAAKAKKAAMTWKQAVEASKEGKTVLQQAGIEQNEADSDGVDERGRIFSDGEFGLSDEQLQQLTALHNWKQRSMADGNDVAGEGTDADFGLSDEQLKALLEKYGDNLENTEAILSEMGVPEQTIKDLKCIYKDALDIPAVMAEVQAAKAKKAAMTWKQAVKASKEGKTVAQQASTKPHEAESDAEVDERGRIFSDAEFGLSDEQLQQLIALHSWKQRSMADGNDVAADSSDADFGLSDEQLKALLEKYGENVDNAEAILSDMGVPEKTITALKEKYNDVLDISAVVTEVQAAKAKKAAKVWKQAAKANKEAKQQQQDTELDGDVDDHGRIFFDAEFGLSDEQLQQLTALHNWKQRSMEDGNDVAGDGSDADFGVSDEQLKALLEKYGDNLENTEAILSEMGVPEQTINDLQGIYKDALDIPAVMTEVQVAKATKAAMLWKQAVKASKEGKTVVLQASPEHQEADSDEEVDERGRMFSDAEFGLSDEQVQHLMALHNWKQRSMADGNDEAGDGSDADFGLSDEQLKALLEKYGNNLDNAEAILSEMGVPEKTIKSIKEKYSNALDISAVVTEVQAAKAKKAARMWKQAVKAKKEAKAALKLSPDQHEDLMQLNALAKQRSRDVGDAFVIDIDNIDDAFVVDIDHISEQQIAKLTEKYGDDLEDTAAILTVMGAPEKTIQDLRSKYGDELSAKDVLQEVGVTTVPKNDDEVRLKAVVALSEEQKVDLGQLRELPRQRAQSSLSRTSSGSVDDASFGLSDDQLLALQAKYGENLNNTEAVLTVMGVPEETIQELQGKYGEALNVDDVLKEAALGKEQSESVAVADEVNGRSAASDLALTGGQLQDLADMDGWSKKHRLGSSTADSLSYSQDDDADFSISQERLNFLQTKYGAFENTQAILTEMGVPEATIQGLADKYGEDLDLGKVVQEARLHAHSSDSITRRETAAPEGLYPESTENSLSLSVEVSGLSTAKDLASLNSEGMQEQLQDDDDLTRETCHDFDDKAMRASIGGDEELSSAISDDAEPEVINKAISPDLVASLAQSIGSSEARSSSDLKPRIRLSLVRNNLQRVKDQLERTSGTIAAPEPVRPNDEANEFESPAVPPEASVGRPVPEGDYLSPTRLRRHTIASYSPGFPSPPVIPTPLTHRSVEADADQVELQEAPPNIASASMPRTSDFSREDSSIPTRESTNTTARTSATSQMQVQALQAALAEMLPPGSMQAQSGHGLHLQDLLSPRVSDILSPILSPREQSQVQSMCCWIWSGISAPLVPVFDALGVATRSCYSRENNRSLLEQENSGPPQELHLNKEGSTILSRRQAQAEATSGGEPAELEVAPVSLREESRLPTGPAEIVD